MCKSQRLTPKSASVLMFLFIWLSECWRAEAPLRALANPMGTYLSSGHERNARHWGLPTLKPTNDTRSHCMNLCMYIHGHVSSKKMHWMHVTTDHGIEVEPLLYACNHLKFIQYVHYRYSVVCNVIKWSCFIILYSSLYIFIVFILFLNYVLFLYISKG